MPLGEFVCGSWQIIFTCKTKKKERGVLEKHMHDFIMILLYLIAEIANFC